MPTNVRPNDESPPESEREVLFVTTNDVTDPARGGDRRSHQIKRWLSRWNTLHSVSYRKESGSEDEEKGPASDREHVVPYPESKLLAPFDPRVLSRVLRLGSERDFDWIVVSDLGSFFYGVVAALVLDARLVVDCHNAERSLGRQLGSLDHYLLAATVGRLALGLADLVVFTSDSDRARHSEQVRAKSVVVANGFDSETFFPREGGEETDSEVEKKEIHTVEKEVDSYKKDIENVLFFGNMEYPPNREAVEYLGDEVVPRIQDAGPNAEVRVAGPHCEEIADLVADEDLVRVLGLVDDIGACIRDADLVVVPITTGSGTRLKIIESLACGTPVVSTPKGAEGWPSDWENLEIVREAEFAEAVVSAVNEGVSFAERERDEYGRYAWRQQVEKLQRAMRRREEPRVPTAQRPRDSDDGRRRRIAGRTREREVGDESE